MTIENMGALTLNSTEDKKAVHLEIEKLARQKLAKYEYMHVVLVLNTGRETF